MNNEGEHNIKSTNAIACLSICALGFLLYANSLKYPFQFDSIRYIPNNPLLNEPDQFLSFDYLLKEYTRRAFLMSSLALNIKWGGFDPFGFRVLNLTVHILNSILVYFISLNLCRALNLFSLSKGCIFRCSLFSSFLFLSHPLHTESVIMVMSRAGMIAGFFYLSAFLIFQNLIGANKKRNGISKSILWTGIAFCFFAGAGFKQTIATLPCILLIYYACRSEPESAFFRLFKKRRRAIISISFLFLGILFWKLFSDESFLIGYSDAGEAIGRKNYMLSQPAVLIFYYLRLAFFPFNLNVDPDIPMIASIIDPAFLGPLGIIISSLYFCWRLFLKRKPVYLFCLLWMLIVISPSSSIVTLHDLAAEHRVYLSSFGLFFLLSFMICKIFSHENNAKNFKRCICVITLTLTFMSANTLKRSAVWSSESLLWSDAAKKSPGLIRPIVNLARGYSIEGRGEEAIAYYKRALTMNPNIFFASYNLGDLYYKKGKTEEAIQLFIRASKIKPSIPETYSRLGEIYMETGQLKLAERSLLLAIEKNPQSAVAFRNLGILNFYKLKKTLPGKNYFQRSLTLDPEQAGAEKIRKLLNEN